ncbi:hypothetical protein HDV00_006952 [Rhizophlyctis rosea]|nr:hypothetical protein HDV00_006952 [Rhizophlyctis rosea]
MSSSTPPRPNTLGPLQRAVRIVLTDITKHRNAWQDISADGTGIANSLANAVLKLRTKEQNLTLEDVIDGIEDTEFAEERERIAQLKEELAGIVKKLETLFTKLQKTYQTLQNHFDDTANNLGEDYVYTLPLFFTSPLETFVNQTHTILTQHRKELALKRAIAEGIPRIRDRREAMLHISAWLQQPYLEDGILEAIDEVWGLEMIGGGGGGGI